MLTEHQHYQNPPCFNSGYVSVPRSLSGKTDTDLRHRVGVNGWLLSNSENRLSRC